MFVEDDGDEAPKKRPPLGQRVYAAVEQALGPAAPALAPTLFVLGWLYVNLLLGSPAPEDGYALGGFAPSPEALALFALIGVITTLRGRPSGLLTMLAMVALFPAWLLRAADRWARSNLLERAFHPALDRLEAWEAFILLDDTVDRFTIVLTVLGLGLTVGLAFALAHLAFAHARRFFVGWPQRGAFLTVSVLLIVGELTTGTVFSESLVGHAAAEVGYGLGLEDERAARASALEGAIAELGSEHSLATLREADVHLLVVPRYAQLLRDDPRFSTAMRVRWDLLENALVQDGYAVRSTLLGTSGPRGFLPRQALALQVGAPLEDELAFAVAVERAPRTLGTVYGSRGYRTVHVLAGDVRDRSDRDPDGYTLTQHSWELGYLGPAFGRSPMPDQYVLSVIRDREVWETADPLFIVYELSSTAPPFDPLPPVVPWRDVGRGDVFREPTPPPSSTTVFALQTAEESYAAAVGYLLDVLEGYLTDAVDQRPPRGRGRESRRARRRRPAPLYVVVGDRPPLPALAGEGAPTGVIAHVISRESSLLSPFEAAGWTEGVTPTAEEPSGGHEALTRLLTEGVSAEPSSPPRRRRNRRGRGARRR